MGDVADVSRAAVVQVHGVVQLWKLRGYIDTAK